MNKCNIGHDNVEAEWHLRSKSGPKGLSRKKTAEFHSCGEAIQLVKKGHVIRISE